MTTTLEMRETSPGVAEVYAGDYQVGIITWDPKTMTTGWFATYANGDATVRCADREAALEHLRLQHAVVQRLVRSIRSIRPANESHRLNTSLREWDRGHNSALRTVEHILTQVAGPAPDGEGYTAITGGQS